MEELFWECFFNNAGVNGQSSKEYSEIFVENKISKSLIPLINDNYLKAMGITAIGDIIRILNHCKSMCDQKSQGRVTTEKAKAVFQSKPNETAVKLKKSVPRPPAPTAVAVQKLPVSKLVTTKSSYQKPAGCEVPIPVRRVVTPEMEGGYIISYPKNRICQVTSSPTSSMTSSATRRTIIRSATTTGDQTESESPRSRTVILTKEDVAVETKVQPRTVLDRLGKSEPRPVEEDEDEQNDGVVVVVKSPVEPRQQRVIDTVDNKTILKRFFNATLSRDSQTKVHLSRQLSDRAKEISRGHVSTRLCFVEDDSTDKKPLAYKGVFKLPNNKMLDIATGNSNKHNPHKDNSHQNQMVRRVEATSTTRDDEVDLDAKDCFIQFPVKKYRKLQRRQGLFSQRDSVMDRLGRK